jgi:hypothetical protein
VFKRRPWEIRYPNSEIRLRQSLVTSAATGRGSLGRPYRLRARISSLSLLNMASTSAWVGGWEVLLAL